MKIGFYALLLCVGSLSISCKVKKQPKTTPETTVLEAPIKEAKKSSMEVCNSDKSSINWYTYSEQLEFPSGSEIDNYKAYSTDPNLLDEYFLSRADDGNSSFISLPIYIDEILQCIPFELTESNTMSPELRAKYGGIKAFKGQAVDDPSKTIRLEYSAEFGLRAYLNIDDKVFLFMPLQQGQEKIYICYDKRFAGNKKLPFEK